MADKPVILAVDDAPENLDVVKSALGNDYIIKAAINGNIALKIVSKSPPDLVLLDVMMPGMDGYEVCQRLKAGIDTGQIPVVFLTGETGPEVESRTRELGARGYVSKPINASTLKTLVNEIITGAS
jgi:putative two-component system response regulator